jgi:hypothetical protein
MVSSVDGQLIYTLEFYLLGQQFFHEKQVNNSSQLLYIFILLGFSKPHAKFLCIHLTSAGETDICAVGDSLILDGSELDHGKLSTIG